MVDEFYADSSIKYYQTRFHFYLFDVYTEGSMSNCYKISTFVFHLLVGPSFVASYCGGLFKTPFVVFGEKPNVLEAIFRISVASSASPWSSALFHARRCGLVNLGTLIPLRIVTA